MSAKASKEITPEEHAIIELAWCDKTSFDEIEPRYDVPKGDVILNGQVSRFGESVSVAED